MGVMASCNVDHERAEAKCRFFYRRSHVHQITRWEYSWFHTLLDESRWRGSEINTFVVIPNACAARPCWLRRSCALARELSLKSIAVATIGYDTLLFDTERHDQGDDLVAVSMLSLGTRLWYLMLSLATRWRSKSFTQLPHVVTSIDGWGITESTAASLGAPQHPRP